MVRLLTIPETAEVLRCSRERAYELARDGRIPALRLSPRRIRVPEDELAQWIAENTTPGRTEHERVSA